MTETDKDRLERLMRNHACDGRYRPKCDRCLLISALEQARAANRKGRDEMADWHRRAWHEAAASMRERAVARCDDGTMVGRAYAHLIRELPDE